MIEKIYIASYLASQACLDNLAMLTGYTYAKSELYTKQLPCCAAKKYSHQTYYETGA